jgi:hypothetical protein
MAHHIYEVSANIKVNGMRIWLSSPCDTIDENLTECLQKYLLLGYERKLKYLTLNANHNVLVIIPREHNSGFHHRTGGTCRARS